MTKYDKEWALNVASKYIYILLYIIPNDKFDDFFSLFEKQVIEYYKESSHYSNDTFEKCFDTHNKILLHIGDMISEFLETGIVTMDKWINTSQGWEKKIIIGGQSIKCVKPF